MASQQVQQRRGAGRPRSAQAHQAILNATLELLADEGVDGMSVDAVAARAHVSKATIYRRWPSKEALVLGAVSELHGGTHAPIADTGNFRSDMVALLREGAGLHASFINPMQVKLLYKIVGEVYTHPELFRIVYNQLIAPHLQRVGQLIEQAQARGELRQDLDVVFVTGLVVGPLLLHALTSTVKSMPYAVDDLVELTVDSIVQGIKGRSSEE